MRDYYVYIATKLLEQKKIELNYIWKYGFGMINILKMMSK